MPVSAVIAYVATQIPCDKKFVRIMLKGPVFLDAHGESGDRKADHVLLHDELTLADAWNSLRNEVAVMEVYYAIGPTVAAVAALEESSE
jgi:hypothetical protein